MGAVKKVRLDASSIHMLNRAIHNSAKVCLYVITNKLPATGLTCMLQCFRLLKDAKEDLSVFSRAAPV